MATKKNANPQPVTFHKGRYEVTMINENQTKFLRLYHVRLYDEAGTVATLSENELYKGMGAHIEIVVTLPIVWNSRKAPDFTETRAHIAVRDSFGERKYTLFIPHEAVTMDNGAFHYSSSRHTFSATRYFTVKEFPRKFSAWASHPFEQYKMINELEALQKEQYRVLTGDDIITPYARQRIAEFFATLQEYTAEAQRIHDLTEEEFLQECGINGARYRWNDGSFYRIKDEEPAA